MYCLLLLCMSQSAVSQTEEFHGQASGWISANHDSVAGSVGDLRYIPDLLLEKKLNEQFDANVDISLNTFATAQYANNESPSYDEEVKLYRGWVRLSTEKFEVQDWAAENQFWFRDDFSAADVV